MHSAPVGEIVVGPCKTLFMDEISTGLDSSTTFQIVSCIRNMVRMRNVRAHTSCMPCYFIGLFQIIFGTRVSFVLSF